jgi:hypothetical protein
MSVLVVFCSAAILPQGTYRPARNGPEPSLKDGSGPELLGCQPTNSLSSRRMAAFGRAPTMVLTISPLLKTAMVGIDMTR